MKGINRFKRCWPWPPTGLGKLVLCGLLGLYAFASAAQESKKPGIVNRYLSAALNDTTSAEKAKFLAYPSLAFAPETRWELGIVALYLYHAKNDTSNRLSEITAFTFVTQERQWGVWSDHAFYSDKDQFFLLGRIRYQFFPLLYYGVGPGTSAAPSAVVNANYLIYKERFLGRLAKNFYAGLQLDYQGLSRVNFDTTGRNSELAALPLGANGSRNLGLGLGLVYDNRYNVLNVREGLFTELAFLHSNPAWGSSFQFSQWVVDGRFYHTTRPSQVLALQGYGQFTYGDVPFHQLALMGGETLMRGYYTGRYRDNHYMALQAEYRWLPFAPQAGPFWNRFGGAVFAGAGTVFSEQNTLAFDNTVWAAGAGARFLIFRKKDVYTRFDAAFTNEGPNFYLFLGEAF